jgi:hypothetical protein
VFLIDTADAFMIAILRDGLSDHPSLQTLCLRFRKEQDNIPVAKALEKCLQSNPANFKTLNFYSSHFSLETLQPVIHGLLQNSTIQMLRFYSCEFVAESEYGGTSSAIPALKTLLESPDAKIVGDAGAMALADAICDDEYPASIAGLCLCRCTIGTAGLASIFEALPYAPTLKMLNLQYIHKDSLNGAAITSHDVLFSFG